MTTVKLQATPYHGKTSRYYAMKPVTGGVKLRRPLKSGAGPPNLTGTRGWTYHQSVTLSGHVIIVM